MPGTRPHLRELAALYFHQDYDREYPDADSALRDFVSGYDHEFVACTVQEILSVLSEGPTEEQLRTLWLDRNHAYFEPDRAGLSYREWFDHMLEVLRGHSE